jgi:AAA domain/Toprim-like
LTVTAAESPPAARFSKDALQYFEDHAIAPVIAVDAGVTERRPATLTFPYVAPDGTRFERKRPLNGDKTIQPSGQKLTLWRPFEHLENGRVLVCEGEPDALAARSAQRAAAPDDSGMRFFASIPVAAVPGTGYPPEQLAADLVESGVEEAWLAFDGDEAGRKYRKRVVEALMEVRIRPIPVELPDGRDLADCLAAESESERAEWLASTLADPEASAPALPDEPEPNDGHVELRVLSARDLCALPDPPGEELLGELLGGGRRIVLGADTGAGKTTLVMGATKAVAEGGSFLGWSAKRARARVLVLDAEQSLRTIKRRLHESGLDESLDVDFVRAPDGLSLDTDNKQVAALEAVLEAGAYDLVIADPLYKLHAGDSNAEREAVDLMRRFDAWRERFGFALLLVVHTRKPPPGAKFTMNEFFGSSAYLRGADVVIGLRRVGPGYSRVYFFKDRDGDLPVGESWGLLFDRESGFRRDPNDGKAKPTAKDRVHDLLEERDMTIQELVAETGYSDRTIRDAVKALKSELGAVASSGPHNEQLWTLPEAEAA